MGHTNSTANLSLPQFIGTDKPTWLGDVNGAFLAIDGYAGTNDAAVAAAASDARSALSQASAAVNTANTANTTAGNASTAANNAIGVANTANAIAGTVDAKVGLLADLNTTDRTSIVNAINEVADQASGASSVSVTGDGVKTYGQLLNSLYALADFSKLRSLSRLIIEGATSTVIAPITALNAADAEFSVFDVFNNGFVGKTVNFASSSTFYAVTVSGGTDTYTDFTSGVQQNGLIIKLEY